MRRALLFIAIQWLSIFVLIQVTVFRAFCIDYEAITSRTRQTMRKANTLVLVHISPVRH